MFADLSWLPVEAGVRQVVVAWGLRVVEGEVRQVAGQPLAAVDLLDQWAAGLPDLVARLVLALSAQEQWVVPEHLVAHWASEVHLAAGVRPASGDLLAVGEHLALVHLAAEQLPGDQVVFVDHLVPGDHPASEADQLVAEALLVDQA